MHPGISEQQEETLLLSIQKVGVLKQLDSVNEGCGRLLQNLNKIKTVLNYDVSNGIPAPASNTDVSYSLLYFSLISDVAELEILLSQLGGLLNPEAIQLSVNRKIDRMEKILIN